ncbi:MAG TPA: hypothetical protein VMF06_16085 [Candidatus Limnocylindria bacterium]|jgi:hypothetical protein|nr:hypothetical protein [Candidatus Limnocylindria bacterium]
MKSSLPQTDRRSRWLAKVQRGERVFEWIAAGWSIRRVAAELSRLPKAPPRLDEGFLASWLLQPALQDRYRTARAQAVERLVDELLPLADEAAQDPSPERMRAVTLQVDVRRWLAARWMPQWYADKPKVETSGGPTLEQALLSLTEKPYPDRKDLS